MKRLRWLVIILIVIAPLTVLPNPTFAQVLPGWDLSVAGFGGGSFPFDGLRNSVSFGGKVQAWTTAARAKTGLDFGTELDVTQFFPDLQISGGSGVTGSPSVGIPGAGNRVGNAVGPSVQDVNATIIGLNLLVRWPVGANAEVPNGRWYPYLGIGGGAEIARMAIPFGLRRLTDTDTAPALQALVGAKLFLNKHVGLFVEYKFTYAAHTFRFDSRGVQVTPPVSFSEDITVKANHVVGGIAIHF